MKILKLVGCVGMLSVILAMLPTLSVGQDTFETGGVWSPPLRLGYGWWQSMNVDRQGRLHVGWYDVFKIPTATDSTKTVDADLLRYASRSLDGEWTIPNDIQYTGLGGLTVRNSFAATSDGMLHVVFRAGGEHLFSSAYSLLASNAAAWSPGEQVNPFGYYVTLFADSSDVLHLVYNGRIEGLELQNSGSELTECGGCGDVIYIRSTDEGGSWSVSRALTDTVDSSSEKMDFLEGKNGRIYLYWDEGIDWYQGRGKPVDVRIIYSDDHGLTWSDPIILDGGNLTERRPVQLTLTEMDDGTLLAAWRYASDADPAMYYQTSPDSGETWTDPEPVPGFINNKYSTLGDFDSLTDETGGVHLFAVGYTELRDNVNPSLYHLVYRQGIWLPPQRIMYSPKLIPEWPKARMGLQNDIHLTWFTRSIDEKIGFIESESYKEGFLNVYYSHMEGNLPLQATVEFNPTYTPIPSPTPFQLLDATLTPFPTIQVENRNSFVATQDQYATETLFGGLGAIALFCGAVVALIRLRRS